MPNPKSSLPLFISLLFISISTSIFANFSFDEINDFSAAKQRAGEDGKLIFIEFSANWCMPCKILEENTLNLPDIKHILKQDYISVKLDIEHQRVKEWKEKFNVFLVPTIIILDSKGHVLNKTESTLASSALKQLIQKHNISSNKAVIYSKKTYASRTSSPRTTPRKKSTIPTNRSVKTPSTSRVTYTKPSPSKSTVSSRSSYTKASTKTTKTKPVSSAKTKRYTNSKTRTSTSSSSRRTTTKRKTTSSSSRKIGEKKTPVSAARKKRLKSIKSSQKKKNYTRKSTSSSSKRSTSSSSTRIASSGVYKVKVGSYSKYENVKKSLSRIQKFNLGNPKILEYKEGRKKRYKIIIGRFHDKSNADALLKILNKKGFQGEVVSQRH